MNHASLIVSLGDGTELSKEINARTGRPVDRDAVYKWKRNGVPWRWRQVVADIARERNVLLPQGFLAPESQGAAQ